MIRDLPFQALTYRSSKEASAFFSDDGFCLYHNRAQLSCS
jgi:hypothetical protein